MKKVLSIVLSLVIIIGLAGCILSLSAKENNGGSSKESVNSSISSDDKIEDSSSTETPSDSSSTLPEDSSSSGEEVDDNINYTIVFESTEYPMTAKKGTTWATAEYGATIPPMTNEDIWGMYYLESANVIWRLKNSDMTYSFIDDEILANEVYTLLSISCGPIGLQYIDGTSNNFAYFEAGMTWIEWVNSVHNSYGYYFDETGLTRFGNNYLARNVDSTSLVKQTEGIVSQLYYEVGINTIFYFPASKGTTQYIVPYGTTWAEFISNNEFEYTFIIENNYIYYIDNDKQSYITDDETNIAVKADSVIIGSRWLYDTQGIYYFSTNPSFS